MEREPTRREFVATGASLMGGAWAAFGIPGLAALAGCARDAARSGEPFRVLDATRGRTLIAVAERILPADALLPGATDAGAAWFVDRALESFFAGMAEPVTACLDDLDARASADGGPASFADLPAERQDEMLAAIQDEPPFSLVRMLVVIGTFSDPSYGGNRGGAGWRIAGFTPEPVYEPPFGHYDGEAMRGTA